MSRRLRHIVWSAVCGGLTLPLAAGCAQSQLSLRPSVSRPRIAAASVAPTGVARLDAPPVELPTPVEPQSTPEVAAAPAAAPLQAAPNLPLDGEPAVATSASDSALALWREAGAKDTRSADSDGLTLDASGTSIDDADLESLKSLPQLRNLNLRGTGVTDAGLAALRFVPELEFLGLSQTAVTDVGLAQLTSLQRLRYLTLADTAISDAGVWHLVGLQKLAGLNLKGTQITRNGLMELQARLPECKIVVDDALLAAGSLFLDDVHYGHRPSRSPELLAPGDFLSGADQRFIVPLLDDETPEQRVSRILEEHFSDARLLTALGDLYRERGELEDAVTAYHEAVARSPDDIDVQYRLGVALAELGDLHAARRALWRSVGPAAGDYNIAVILYRQGRLADARTAAESALEQDAAFLPARELIATLSVPSRPIAEDVRVAAPSPTLGLLLRALQAESAAPRPRSWQVAIQPSAARRDLAMRAPDASRPLINQAVLGDDPVPVILPLEGRQDSVAP
jgi:tetratricopeptide (TPR) repeat protein